MDENGIFIGKLIHQQMEQQGKSATWLAQQLGCQRTNVYKIYTRRSIDTAMLLSISQALNHNFFIPYVEVLQK